MQKYPSIPLAQMVVRLCDSFSIQRVVICPGSRNAPLTNGFVSHPNFITYSIVDERAAAFFALGMAQQLMQPVALVCTSGSALLNFYPAIAEAFYSDIPLVILSADRMPHSIDIGDGQTIRQKNVFSPHVEAEASLLPDVIHATSTLIANPLQTLVAKATDQKTIEAIQLKHQQQNEKEIARVLSAAIQQQGPVHLNIPLEEPLYEMTKNALSVKEYPIPKKKEAVSESEMALCKTLWHSTPNKWVIIGQMAPNQLDEEWITQLCNDPSVVVFSETTSNVFLKKGIASIDTLMAPLEQIMDDSHDITPSILLTFGGMVVSKKIKAFLRKNQPEHHWHVDPKKAYNTYYCLNQHFKCTPNAFFKSLYTNFSSQSNSSFQPSVLKVYNAFKQKGQEYINTLPFSDFYVFKTLAAVLPSSYHLQVANSSSIRYTQLLDWSKGIQFFSNRGTSGIDGSTATAVGAAQINPLPTLLITGDLSFFYDVNGLWNNHVPSNFKIILINNNGGGIFRILPGEKDTSTFDTYFETLHERKAKYIAKAFDFEYQHVHSKWRLKQKLTRFFADGKRPKIIEIETPRQLNDQVLLNYFKSMTN